MKYQEYTLDYDTAVDPDLQQRVTEVDTLLRTRHGMAESQAAVGVLDLRTGRLAMARGDRLFYGASVPKVAILLAYFELNPQASTALDDTTRMELGLMIKNSSNELAAKYSQQLGLEHIREVLARYRFYDERGGGGIWMGKHYGVAGERMGDPIGDHSHAATVRQLLRFFLLLDQGRLVSAQASQTMLEIFASPGIQHDQMKFVKGLEGRDVSILRKSGSWENWLHDAAIIQGEGRHYILVGLTEHPNGDAYLEQLAREVDNLLAPAFDPAQNP